MMRPPSATTTNLLLLGSAKFRAFRCLWMLEELQVPFQHDFMARPQSKVARKYHPLGKIPSLVVFDNIHHQNNNNDDEDHGGQREASASSSSYWSLYESTAINTFLADTYGKFIPPHSSTTPASLVLLQQQPQQHQQQYPSPTAVDGNDLDRPSMRVDENTTTNQIRNPTTTTMRSSTTTRAYYDQTIAFILSELDAQGLWIHRKHESLSSVFGKAPEAVLEAKRQFDRANQVLVHQLDQNKRRMNSDEDASPTPPATTMTTSTLSSSSPSSCYYLLGEEFTAADILYVHCLDWAEMIGWNDHDVFASPVLVEYLKSCREREAYQRTVARRVEEDKFLAKFQKEKVAKQSQPNSGRSSNDDTDADNSGGRSKL